MKAGGYPDQNPVSNFSPFLLGDEMKENSSGLG